MFCTVLSESGVSGTIFHCYDRIIIYFCAEICCNPGRQTVFGMIYNDTRVSWLVFVALLGLSETGCVTGA